MPWNQDQQRIGKSFANLLVRVQYQLLLTIVGAGGDPDRPILKIVASEGVTAVYEVLRQLDVEFDVAGYFSSLGCSAQRPESFSIGLTLRRNDDAVRQCFTKKWQKSAVCPY